MFEDKFLSALEDTISDLLCAWSPSAHHSDWKCVFCGNRPATAHDNIQHADDCKGKAHLAILIAARQAREDAEWAKPLSERGSCAPKEQPFRGILAPAADKTCAHRSWSEVCT